MLRIFKKIRICIFILIVSFLIIDACTIKKINEVDKNKSKDKYSTWTKSGKKFDPVEYVNSIWSTKLIPEFRTKSTDIKLVLSALKKDRKNGIKLYGRIRKFGGTSAAFRVKGKAKVLKYDNSSMNGLLLLDLLPPDGKKDLDLQVGPVIRQTAIRDSADFITFTDVGNQLQFASLADELNNRIKKEVIKPLDLEHIAGETISFLGAFKLEESDSIDDIAITPIEIKVVKTIAK
ncbi:MAG: DUF2291 domain-containing protein [Spirochaetes bacterium]|nr:MAG: DUF2291 domain-containing protein [Spirochaetota bacterium]